MNMEPHKFKPGDKVRWTCERDDHYDPLDNGITYTVRAWAPSDSQPCIFVNNSPTPYFEWRFELDKESLFDSLYLRMI